MTKEREYEQYLEKKKRLYLIYKEKQEKAKKIKKKPKDKGQQEAGRFTSRSRDAKEKGLQMAAQNALKTLFN